MIRLLVVNPVLVVLAAAAGVAACRAGHVSPHFGEMMLASGICLAAAELAVLPALLHAHDSDAGTLTRSALAGTVVHLGVVLILAVGVMMALRPPLAFVLWLLALYWVTLIGLCSGFALALRAPARAKKANGV